MNNSDVGTFRNPLEKGIRMFNQCLYKEAHEEWEKIWKHLQSSPEKSFLQGLIMITTAFHKYERDEFSGMEKLFGKGIRLVRENRQAAFGIDIEKFLGSADKFWNRYLSGREKLQISDLPKIS
jgi:predicted metal-dependent hydrolase